MKSNWNLLLAITCLVTSFPSLGRAQRGVDRLGDPLPRNAVVRFGTVRFRNIRRNLGSVYIEDGKKLLAVAEGDSQVDAFSVRIFDSESGKPEKPKVEVEFSIRGFAWHRSGKIAVVGSMLNPQTFEFRPQLAVYELGGKKLAQFDWSGREARTVRWINSHTIVTVGEDGSLKEWDLEAGKLAKDHTPIPDSPRLAATSDGSVVAVGGRRAAITIRKWNEPQADQKTVKLPQDIRISGLRFSPDNKRLVIALGFRRGGVAVADVASGKLTHYLRSPDRHRDVGDAHLTPDGTRVVGAGSTMNNIHVWDLATSKLIRTISVKPHRPRMLSISPDSKRVSMTDDTVVRQFDLETGKEIGRFPEAHVSPGINVATCEDPRILVSGGQGGKVCVWDAETGKLLRQMQHDHPEGGFAWIRGIALSPDGKLVVSGGADNTTRVWEVATGKEIFRLPGHGENGGQWRYAFSADGKQFVTAGDDFHLRIWDSRNGKCLEEHILNPGGKKDPGPDPFERFLTLDGHFSDDGSRLIVQFGGELVIYDVNSGNEITRASRANVRHYRFTPDNKQLLVSRNAPPRRVTLPDGRETQRSSRKHSFELIQLSNRKSVFEADEREGYPGPIAMAPNGKWFAATASRSPRRIDLWSTSGKRLGIIGRFASRIHDLEFSADGRYLYSSHEDTNILKWKVPERLIKKQ